MIKKQPSIGQLRNVVHSIKQKSQFVGMDDNNLPIMKRDAVLPTLPFKGTVKLHGTNASIIFSNDSDIVFQSKNRQLSINNDNSGFMNHMLGDNVGVKKLTELHQKMTQALLPNKYEKIAVFGEWCGEGIMKGVAINQLPRMFVIFDVYGINGDESVNIPHNEWDRVNMPDIRIFNIHQFQTYTIEIDFNKPEMIQNALIDYTQQVEDECPIAKHFGISGCGEGIVYKCTDPDYNDPAFWLKIKGEKHSVSKVKTLAPVDVEKMKSVDDFMDKVVTENRLNQGIEYLVEMGLEVTEKSTGQFISWVFKDCLKEESDTLEASGLNKKDIGKPLGTLSRKWYFKKLEEF
jgi:RNA ligase